jgi:hypothetical protein
MILDYRPRREGQNPWLAFLPPRESDAFGFIAMAVWIVGFMLAGLVFAAALSLFRHS